MTYGILKKKKRKTFPAGQFSVADVPNEQQSTVRSRLNRMLAESNVNPQLLPDTWCNVLFRSFQTHLDSKLFMSQQRKNRKKAKIENLINRDAV